MGIRSIAGTVLISGLYDLQQFLAHPRSIQAALLKYSALRQTDGSNLAFRARSALYSDIKTSSLIMNGAQDDRTDPNQARRLAEKIKSNGGVAQIHIYPEYGHYIPVDAREREVDAFIDSVLKPSGGS